MQQSQIAVNRCHGSVWRTGAAQSCSIASHLVAIDAELARIWTMPTGRLPCQGAKRKPNGVVELHATTGAYVSYALSPLIWTSGLVPPALVKVQCWRVQSASAPKRAISSLLPNEEGVRAASVGQAAVHRPGTWDGDLPKFANCHYCSGELTKSSPFASDDRVGHGRLVNGPVERRPPEKQTIPKPGCTSHSNRSQSSLKGILPLHSR